MAKKKKFNKKKVILGLTSAVVTLGVVLGVVINTHVKNNKPNVSEKPDPVIEEPVTKIPTNNEQTPDGKDQDIIEDTDDPIIGDEDPIDDLIEYYTEAEYKQMSEAKIKEFVVELFDATTVLTQYTINNIENLVVNFADGNVYFNANYTWGNQNGFCTASLGEVITSATSYKSLHSNLKTAKFEDATIKIDARIANSIGEEKTIELNDYVLEQVGINKDNARVLNTSGFKAVNGMLQLSITVIDGSQIKVVTAATYITGINNSVNAILAGRESNVLEVASSNSYLGEIVADTKVTSSRFSKVPFSKDIKDLIILASASICPGN